MGSDFKYIDRHLSKCCFIPVGFRCNTKATLIKNNLVTRSLPFDSGFFPPHSITSVLRSGELKLTLNEKLEPMNFSLATLTYTGGIHFTKRSEMEILKMSNQSDSFHALGEERLMDVPTHGYFATHLEHKFTLAHYLWTKHSQHYKTHYTNLITDINKMFQRRLDYMYEICNQNFPIFIFTREGKQDYFVNNEKFKLDSFVELKEELNKQFGDNLLLIFSQYTGENNGGIFYHKLDDYEDFCKYVRSQCGK